MLYEILRVTARLALRWHYSELIVRGRERIPAEGPLLVVANHPNALVDAMLVSTTVARRVSITARATLFDGHILAGVLRRIGVVPLLRVQDVPMVAGAPTALVRNDISLDRVTEALQLGEVVVIFPEGISHDSASMAPLKSGAARIALQALAKGAHNLCILPIGLVYEAKERPGTRILVNVGRPIAVGRWLEGRPGGGAAALTREIALELRRITLNFAAGESAERSIRLARAVSMLRGDFAPPARRNVHGNVVDLASRIEFVKSLVDESPALLQARTDLLIDRLQDLETRLEQRGIPLHDALTSDRVTHGPLFKLGEAALACILLPLAILGWVSHWLPLLAARALALCTLRSDPSRDQPAMRTILIGLVAVPAWYSIQAATIAMLAGGLRAALWLSLCFVGAVVDARYRGRLERALRRAYAVVVHQRDRAFQESALTEFRALSQQAAELEGALLEIPSDAP